MASLVGARLPDVALPATDGASVNFAKTSGLLVLFIYPWTGKPGVANPPHWDAIKGAHGSTPQAQAYSMLYDEFAAHHMKVFGLSMQDTAWQKEFVTRNALAFPLVSDAAEHFSQNLRLATFATGGTHYLVRRTLVLRHAMIIHDRQEIALPERDAAEVLDWWRKQ